MAAEYLSWPESCRLDFIELFCGERVGSGLDRTVYDCRVNPNVVVKVETTKRGFQNVFEWEMWDALRGTEMAKYLAPCVHISEAGICLLQKKVEPLSGRYKNVKIPNWLSDLKPDNFGVLDGRVVACDYGLAGEIIGRGVKGTRLVKPDWT